MMKTSRKAQATKRSGIRGNHTRRNGPILVYVIVFVSLSIVMITLNQTRKKQSVDFTKEGELQLMDQNDKILATIEIEIADDGRQTSRGLMYRKSMKGNRGMLFIYGEEQERSFWMKNTFISLDLLYINAQKEIISISENAKPQSEESIWSDGLAQYVLELNAGFVASHRIVVGHKISFKRTY